MKIGVLAAAIVLVSTAAWAQQQMTDAEIRSFIVGKTVNYSDGGSSQFFEDGQTSYTRPSGETTPKAPYSISNGRVCIDFANGRSRCDRYFKDASGPYLLNASGNQYRMTTAAVGATPPPAGQSLKECEQTLNYALQPSSSPFSGIWVGKWDMGMCGVLIVENVQGAQAAVLYGWGSFALGGSWAKAGNSRYSATIAQSTLTIPGTISFEFTLQGTTQLAAKRTSRGGVSTATFTKR